MTRRTEEQLIADGIKHTVMAIREEMMEYFKGTCVSRLVDNAGIYTDSISLQSNLRRPYLYQRQNHEQDNPRRLYFGATALGEMHHNADTVSFYPAVMNRSPEFTAIHEQVNAFFSKYLQGVKLELNTTSDYNNASDGSDDKALVMADGVTDQRQPMGGYVDISAGAISRMREYERTMYRQASVRPVPWNVTDNADMWYTTTDTSIVD